MKKKLIIFDLDDCLVDTYGAIVPTIIKQSILAMMKAGLQIQSFNQAVTKLTEINDKSKNGTEAITAFLKELNADERFLEIGKEGFYNFNFNYDIKPLPGVLEMLEKTDADFALVTKGKWESQMEKMRKAGIDQNKFKKIMAVSEYNKKEYYQEIMTELGYSFKDCFVCGDRYETDLLPAKELGIKTIHIPWGRGKVSLPKKGEVDFTIIDFRNLIRIVNPEEENKMNNYKVCILAAGIGSRMIDFCKTFNKALIPVQGKPAICHIIEKFPEDVEIVIAVGYKKETIIDYLSVMYPNRKLNFVEVNKYEGPGTGPGYSLLQCKEDLQCPFIFYAADTLVSDEVPAPENNWFGLAEVPNTERFCSAKEENNVVIRIDDKIKCDNKYAFIGLAGIKDYEHFWTNLQNNENLIDNEIQVSNGFTSLIEKTLLVKSFRWFDTGTLTSYAHALKNYPDGEVYKGE